MSHFVPDLEMEEDDYSIPTSSASGFPRPTKSFAPEDEIMELLWHNGQVVVQSQNQKSAKKPGPSLTSMPQTHRYAVPDVVLPADLCTVREIRSSVELEQQQHQSQHLFMQEDEMTSWLQYPMVDDPPLDPNFCTDLLYPSTVASNDSKNNNMPTTNITTSTFFPVRLSQRTKLPQSTQTAEVLPPRPPMTSTEAEPKLENFAHFSKHNAKSQAEPSTIFRQPSTSKTVVDSSDTPALAPSLATSESGKSYAPVDTARRVQSSAGATTTATLAEAADARDIATCDVTVTSSPGASSASAEAIPKPPTEDRKRKGREPEESETHSEDIEFESLDGKKQALGSKFTKRSRTAEVHNLSERRRRDRINEKMRALQELIPRCNKSDKASMLDEAIEYLKSLQLQVQMMSMGCGMVPMMFPWMQQFMPSMPTMGMGIGVDMGMNRPLMSFPNVLAGSALPALASATHLGPRSPMPPFPMPLVPPLDSSRLQATTQPDPMLTSLARPDTTQPRERNFSDPCQQYLGPHQIHLPLMQNRAINLAKSTNKPGTGQADENPENRRPG